MMLQQVVLANRYASALLAIRLLLAVVADRRPHEIRALRPTFA